MKAQRYVALDGMRGVAALGVAAFHFDPGFAPGGYLAVDFFFVLSGFVLAKAYGERLAEGASVRRFMEMRVIRLYPLFLAGTLLGVAHALQLSLRDGPTAIAMPEIARLALIGVTMLPDPFSDWLYPLNIVFWSIATEIVANLVFAVALARLSNTWLAVVIAVSAVMLVVLSAGSAEAIAGFNWGSIDVGLARTMLSFTVGMVLARTQRQAPRRPFAWAVLLFPALMGPLMLRIGPDERYTFDLAMILLVFPTLVWLGARVEPPRWLARPCDILGDVSYALYATHLPVALGIGFFVRRLALGPATLMPVFLAVAFALALALTHFWDKPIRRWISARLALRRSAMPRVL